MAPPPNTLRLHDLPRAIRLAFERAFAMRGTARPSAADWARELASLEETLAPCPIDPRHIMSSPSTTCPWCRIERRVGRPTFSHTIEAPVVYAAPKTSALHRDVVKAIGNAKRNAGEHIEPLWQRTPAKPGKAARALHARELQDTVPPALRRLGFAAHIPQDFVAERHVYCVDAERHLEEWRKRLGVWELYKACDDLHRRLSAIERYQSHGPSLLARALASIIGQRAHLIMVGESIAGAGLAGIGPALQAQLASRGITSAIDIDRDNLTAIPGLGERRIVALLFWREMIAVAAERKAACSSATTVGAFEAAADAVDRHLAGAEASIHRAMADLAETAARIRNAAAIIDPKLNDALAKRDQALADLDLLGIAADPRQPASASFTLPPLSPTKSRNGKSKPTAGKKIAKGCPRCGSPMVKRWAHVPTGKNDAYLGCSAYPRCDGRRPTRSRQVSP